MTTSQAFRHELKHRMSEAEARVLARRLRLVLPFDPNGGDVGYRVTSLYFDDPYDQAFVDKLEGAARREKYRLRRYGDDLELVRLERKSKCADLSTKQRCDLSLDQARRLAAGDETVLLGCDDPLAEGLLAQLRTFRLRPAVVVAYERLAFAFAPGNVRVTLDSHLRASSDPRSFFERRPLMIPVDPGEVTLEVKWDRFLPDVVRAAVQLTGVRHAAHSKYAACRGAVWPASRPSEA